MFVFHRSWVAIYFRLSSILKFNIIFVTQYDSKCVYVLPEIDQRTLKSLKFSERKPHAAENSFIPLGEAATVTLPSKESIIDNAIELYNE